MLAEAAFCIEQELVDHVLAERRRCERVAESLAAEHRVSGLDDRGVGPVALLEAARELQRARIEPLRNLQRLLEIHRWLVQPELVIEERSHVVAHAGADRPHRKDLEIARGDAVGWEL